MTHSSYELLRSLLPRYYWLRDAEDGGDVLAALLRVIAAQVDELRLDLEQLYDDLFIETCDPRYVPLIGDGIGLEGLAPDAGPGVGDRAWVGRIIGLRRRKGMLATLAHGTTAATGWAAYVQEGRAVVSTTHSLREASAGAAGFADLAGRRPAARFADPWSHVPRGAAIFGRPVIAGEALAQPGAPPCGYPAPAIAALSVWRLRSFFATRRTARAALDAEPALAGRAFRFDPLGRDTRLFARPVEADAAGGAPRPQELPLPLTIDLLDEALGATRHGRPAPVVVAGCETLTAGDLRDWRDPPGGDAARAVVDPLLGRLLLREPRAGVEVSYAYGFPGELGGGPYGSAGDYAALGEDACRAYVEQGPDGSSAPLAAALAAAAGGDATIVLEDSATYIPAGGRWELAVADGRELRIESVAEAAPLLHGDLHVRIARGGRLELSGLTLSGAVTVEGEGELAIEHCTLAPRKGAASVVATGAIAVKLEYSIVGGVDARDGAHVSASSTIVDGAFGAAGTLDLECVTLLGPLRARTLLASDCIFTAAVDAGDGIVRTSYVAQSTRTLPLLACARPAGGHPRFASTRPGDAAYCQLHLRCPRSIAAGASRGGEMGAYNWLGQPERFARLPNVLCQLLPAGVGASVHYVT